MGQQVCIIGGSGILSGLAILPSKALAWFVPMSSMDADWMRPWSERIR